MPRQGIHLDKVQAVIQNTFDQCTLHMFIRQRCAGRSPQLATFNRGCLSRSFFWVEWQGLSIFGYNWL